jgi:hypothetical protein
MLKVPFVWGRSVVLVNNIIRPWSDIIGLWGHIIGVLYVIRPWCDIIRLWCRIVIRCRCDISWSSSKEKMKV